MELHPVVVLFLLSAALKTRFRLLVSFLQQGSESYCCVLADEKVNCDMTNIKSELLLQVGIQKDADSIIDLECKILRVVPVDPSGAPLERDTDKQPNGDRPLVDERTLKACYKCFKETNTQWDPLIVCSNTRENEHYACCLTCHVSCDGLNAVPEHDWFCRVCRSQNRVQ